jgi:hypothetical protein
VGLLVIGSGLSLLFGTSIKIRPFAFQGFAMCQSLTMTVMLGQVVNQALPRNRRIEFEQGVIKAIALVHAVFTESLLLLQAGLSCRPYKKFKLPCLACDLLAGNAQWLYFRRDLHK